MPLYTKNSALSLQRNNLYTEDYKPSHEPLIAVQLALISGVFLIFFDFNQFMAAATEFGFIVTD